MLIPFVSLFYQFYKPLTLPVFLLQIIKAIDIKPVPVLWHEDNVGRQQQSRQR